MKIAGPLDRLIRGLGIGAFLLFSVSAEAAERTLSPARSPTFGCLQQHWGNVSCGQVYLGSEGFQARALVGQSTPPEPSVKLELVGCTRQTQGWECEQPPVLRFIGVAEQSEEPIVGLYVEIDGMPADCAGSTCDVPLEPTPEEGSEVVFSLVTKSNESSEPQFALVRVVEAPQEAGEEPVWQVEILSSRIDDDWIDRCGLAWFALPTLDRPDWLTIPDEADDLRTSESYVYLEQRLAGLGPAFRGSASAGGTLAAAQNVNLTTPQSLIEIWQNQFDTAILEAASARGLPGRLVKSLFAAESQFWPGSFPEMEEVGLGQLSEPGADSLLLWSPPFYAEFCPQVLDAELCRQGYWRLATEHKAMLRGALLRLVNADCPDCAYGLDLPKAERSVPVFAEGLVASCSQTAQGVYNATGNTPGFLSTYEDLWRFTLANYNVGPGCLSTALTDTWQQRQPLDWSHVAANLPGGCRRAIAYVSRVLGEPAE